MWVLKKIGTNMYINQAGSSKSYTPSIKRARKFGSKEQAEGHACGNEHACHAMDEIW